MTKRQIKIFNTICTLECMAINLTGALIESIDANQEKIITDQINAIDIAIEALNKTLHDSDTRVCTFDETQFANELKKARAVDPEAVAKHREHASKFEMQRKKTRFDLVTESPEKLAEFIDSTAGNCEAWCTLNDPIGKYLPVDPCDGKCRAHMVEYLNEVI